jgi:enoyl-CoA hydratase/carnithine racemase
MTDAVEPTVLAEVAHGVGRIVLNRPRALNALDLPMIHSIAEALRRFAADPAVRLVTIEGAGGRAFCAGGDVRAIRANSLSGDFAASEAFFANEYEVNRAIAEFPKPYVALIDGISMGGGLGLSIHGRHRVVTEHAVMAMPETMIALFPDIGASHFMPRLPDRIGIWAALASARLGHGDCLAAGLATHFVPRAGMTALAEALRQEGVAALDRLDLRPPPETLDGATRAAITRCFAAWSVPEIMAALDREGTDWAQAQIAALRAASPTSLFVSLEVMRRGERSTLAQALETELRLTRSVTRHPDFLEGVRAQVVDKTRDPRWQPPTIEQVDPAVIQAMFGG